MSIKILLPCAVALAIASTASADQVVVFDEATRVSVTTRIPGSLEVDTPLAVSPSFDPMPALRDPCYTMILTSTVIEPPMFSSFARMPNDRHPVVTCAPVVVERVALLEPPRVIPPPPPPYVAPYVPPPVYVPPPIEELPHTASLIPLIGLLGLLSLGAAALLRIGRSLAS